MVQTPLENVFDDIIKGNGVKRIVHELTLADVDYTELFIERLKLWNYNPVALKNIDVPVGMRYPGFYLVDDTAYFGHLFWEVFSESRKRKIWGSVIRNEKGDWRYILAGNSSKVVYLNILKPQAVDINYLT